MHGAGQGISRNLCKRQAIGVGHEPVSDLPGVLADELDIAGVVQRDGDLINAVSFVEPRLNA
jgi:hypothetical protein